MVSFWLTTELVGVEQILLVVWAELDGQRPAPLPATFNWATSLRLVVPCGRMRISLDVVLAIVVGCVPEAATGTPTSVSARPPG